MIANGLNGTCGQLRLNCSPKIKYTKKARILCRDIYLFFHFVCSGTMDGMTAKQYSHVKVRHTATTTCVVLTAHWMSGRYLCQPTALLKAPEVTNSNYQHTHYAVDTISTQRSTDNPAHSCSHPLSLLSARYGALWPVSPQFFLLEHQPEGLNSLSLISPGHISSHVHQIVGGVCSRPKPYTTSSNLKILCHHFLECVSLYSQSVSIILTVDFISASISLWIPTTTFLNYQHAQHADL